MRTGQERKLLESRLIYAHKYFFSVSSFVSNFSFFTFVFILLLVFLFLGSVSFLAIRLSCPPPPAPFQRFSSMLRFTLRRFAMGAYSLFMREQKNHPRLKGLAMADRARVLTSMYKNLSPSEKQSLVNRAAATPSTPRKSKIGKMPGTSRTKREPSAYNRFVKENIHQFDKLPHLDRMKAVAKLWQNQKK